MFLMMSWGENLGRTLNCFFSEMAVASFSRSLIEHGHSVTLDSH